MTISVPEKEVFGNLNVLLITSDWKWTGPADPMVRLGVGLHSRGDKVYFACPSPPVGSLPEDRNIAEEVARAGLEISHKLAYVRGFRPLGDLSEVDRLWRFISDKKIGIVHTWHTRDHLLSWRALGALRRPHHVSLVRFYKTGEPIPRHLANRLLYRFGCDGLLCVGTQLAAANIGLCPGPIRGVYGAVDTQRFQPGPVDPKVRIALGLLPQHHVVGIVARAQSHRRFELLLEAARRLFLGDPDARLLIIGRGTRREEIAEAPARRLGIADKVIFSGYRKDDYLDVLRAIDVFTFLVPGSDGTCRALLEAQSCGIPAVTTRRGALKDIVVNERTGFLVDEDPQALSVHWSRLINDRKLHRHLGEAARSRAEERFSVKRFTDDIRTFYQDCLVANT